ncbi:hypothetical protein [Fodinicola acaciae]|uniref:hypothetical protein n=1 Tax=Fodinicola acaciae TaxID=2681555 RepID=UPI0013D82AA3|nr:hypothetical protein [Fodinicola acaciae]
MVGAKNSRLSCVLWEVAAHNVGLWSLMVAWVIGDPLFALDFVDAAPDAETVRVLQGLDLSAADRYECLAVMEVTNRLIAAMQGMQLASMGRFITQYDPLARRYAAAEVASALKWTTRAA